MIIEIVKDALFFQIGNKKHQIFARKRERELDDIILLDIDIKPSMTELFVLSLFANVIVAFRI